MSARPGVDGASRSGPADLATAFRRVASVMLLGLLPLLCLAIALGSMEPTDVAYDFQHELYPEAELVLQGDNPYPPADADLSDGTNNIWPVAAVLPIVPLTLLSPSVANWTITFLLLAALVATLWLLHVRDWRVYGIVLLWPPVINAYQTANVTIALGLLCAIAWRARDRTWSPGVVIGVALAAKLFLWPASLWLAAIGRLRAAVTSLAIGCASLLLVLPFVSISSYVRLLRNLADTFDEKSYTIYALLLDVGAPSPVARAATLAAGAALLALAWRRGSLGLAIGAALVLSPIVWMHFFALLIVPLAIAFPRFAPAWLLALPMWVIPGDGNGRAWQTALGLVVLFAILVACELPSRSTPTSPERGLLVRRAARADDADVMLEAHAAGGGT